MNKLNSQLVSNILVPTDGTALSQKTAERALDFALAFNANVIFYHAKPEPRQSFFGGEGGGFVDQVSHEEFESISTRLANEYLQGLGQLAGAAGVKFELIIGSSPEPYEGIIETATARHCDLIIMASHGRRGIKSLILGSETQKVLTHSKIPVLVYR
jgi:nucleotide-binding universal stress UspA family protein